MWIGGNPAAEQSPGWLLMAWVAILYLSLVSPTSESQLGWVPESELQGRLKHSRAAG